MNYLSPPEAFHAFPATKVSAKLRYVDGTVKGAMLVAAQNVKSGEKILQIPRDLQISDATRMRVWSCKDWTGQGVH